MSNLLPYLMGKAGALPFRFEMVTRPTAIGFQCRPLYSTILSLAVNNFKL